MTGGLSEPCWQNLSCQGFLTHVIRDSSRASSSEPNWLVLTALQERQSTSKISTERLGLEGTSIHTI